MDYILLYQGILFLIVIVCLSYFIKRFRDKTSQVSYQNRLLTALRNLDVVALSTTELETLCQGIVDVIKKELGYFFGAIALIDKKTKSLNRVAISEDSLIDQTLRTFSIDYKKQSAVPITNKNNLLIAALLEKQNKYTSSLYDIQIGVQPKYISDKLQQMLSMKGFFIYPLTTKDKIMGVVYYCTLVEKEKLSRFEFELMNNFSREVARILDNVMLYQTLKDTKQQLEVANQRLKELDQLKDDFVSVASHELRTPMTAIRSYVWMALHKSDIPLSQKLEKYLYRTLLSTERLINLVSDMLNVSRIEAGKIEINPKAFNIVQLVCDVMEEVKVKADEKSLQLLVLEHPLPQVFADSDKAHQVLLNLIGNALKFTYPGGTVTVDFFTDGKMIEVSVKDSGLGIAKDDLSKLFHKFSRLDNSYTAVSTSGGTGLGLYISKSLVELMHGSIRVTSEGTDKGSTFTFSLPIASQETLKHAAQFTVKAKGEVKGLEPVVI